MTDWLKAFRTSSLDLVIGWSFLVLFDVKPTWEMVEVMATLYVVFLVLGVICAVSREARAQR